MRKSLIVMAVLSLMCVGSVGYLAWYIREIPSVSEGSDIQGIPSDLVYRAVQEHSHILSRLTECDGRWQEVTTKNLQDYEQTMSANEEARLQMEQQKEQLREEFVARQLALAKEQAELLAQMQEEARQSVLTQGGTNLNFNDVVHLGQPSQQMSGVTQQEWNGSTAGKTGPVSITESETPVNDTTQVDAMGGTVESGNYYGQVIATYICTCANCHSADVCGEVQVGGNALLTDGSSVPAGVNVVFDGGPSGTYMTHFSTRVSGRNVLILCGEHSIAGTGSTIYPKVTGDKSLG